MGVITVSQDLKVSVAASRVFKATVLDPHHFLPKILPDSIKSVEIVEGDGGAGSIVKTNFTEGSPFKYMKTKMNVVDKDNYVCNYTVIEGDMLGDKLESVINEVKFEGTGEGCVCKMTCHYHLKGNSELKEDEMRTGKENALGLYKAAEAYLLGNPDAYA